MFNYRKWKNSISEVANIDDYVFQRVEQIITIWLSFSTERVLWRHTFVFNWLRWQPNCSSMPLSLCTRWPQPLMAHQSMWWFTQHFTNESILYLLFSPSAKKYVAHHPLRLTWTSLFGHKDNHPDRKKNIAILWRLSAGVSSNSHLPFLKTSFKGRSSRPREYGKQKKNKVLIRVTDSNNLQAVCRGTSINPWRCIERSSACRFWKRHLQVRKNASNERNTEATDAQCLGNQLFPRYVVAPHALGACILTPHVLMVCTHFTRS